MAFKAALGTLVEPFGQKPDAASAQWFLGMVSDAQAKEEGKRHDSGKVLNEWIRVGSILGAAVREGRIKGYGPLRFRWASDQALVLAGYVAQYDSANLEAARAKGAVGSSSAEVNATRAETLALARNVLGQREARNTLKAAARSEESVHDRARSTQNLAAAVEQTLAEVPPAVLADAGLGAGAAKTLRDGADAAVGARAVQVEWRGKATSLIDVLDVFDGRMIEEIRALLRGLSLSRKRDRSLPVVRSSVVRSGKRRKAPTAVEPSEPKPS